VGYREPRRLTELLLRHDEANQRAGVGLTCVRIDANDLVLKDRLITAGYHYVETSLVLSCDRLSRHPFEKVFRRTLPLSGASPGDVEQLRAIAVESFQHSRFHEDIRIPRPLARLRYSCWIDDIVAQEMPILVYRAGDEVFCFMAHRVQDGIVDLVLGGSRRDRGYASPMFWAALMCHFRDAGARQVRARVSAANLGVLRVYFNLFFNVQRVDLGFTKIYPGCSFVTEPS
jgi:hypothetical protein